jgi:hypothetical protein
VVVGRQTGGGKRVGLFLLQHAQGAARLHAQPAHDPHHLEDLLKRGSVRHVTPRRAHAEPCRPLLTRTGRRQRQLVERHQVGSGHLGLVVRRLRAVRAVLGASARLDAEEHAALHLVGAVKRTVSGLRAEHEIGKRRRVNRADFSNRPVVTDGGDLVHLHIHAESDYPRTTQRPPRAQSILEHSDRCGHRVLCVHVRSRSLHLYIVSGFSRP